MIHGFLSKLRLACFIAVLAFSFDVAAQHPAHAHLWERAAYGDIPGLSYVRLVGVNGGPTTSFEALWKESITYVPETAPTPISTPQCASSDANDTSAGTGARTAKVYGVNATFTPFVETITLLGQTPVPITTPNAMFLYKTETITAGSGGLNAGVLRCGNGTFTAGVPATPRSHQAISSATVVTSDGNQSEMFLYAVPAGSTLICKNWQASSVMATAANIFQIVLDTWTDGGLRKRIALTMGEAGGGNPASSNSIIKFAEKTLIVGQVQGASAAAIQLTADCVQILNSWQNTGQDLF